MGKKRPFTVEKRAQITIFMILGFLLLLIFLFLMQVANQAEKSKFSMEQEKVSTKAFKKESLRLFVDDCLKDELEKGLLLLGRQGTLWSDQPGGIKPFSEGLNGFTYSSTEETSEYLSGRIAYGIIAEHYPEFPRAYPCDSELNPPIFCQYFHPNTAAGFGTTKLFTSTFSSDLKQFLLERTAWCVENFIHTDVSGAAEIIPTDLELDLSIDEQGLNAKVNYPLKFKVGGEEVFSLSTFDFFYPSRFKQLLDVASFALAQDKNLVDFNLTPETFTRPIFTYSSEQQVGPCVPFSNYFLCERSLPLDTYQSLGLTFTKESPAAANGDDIFTFTPSLYEIVDSPEPYSLRIARQNRPPALDYVQRASCPAEGYDYLVIKEDERYGYGDINLIPHAIDPDEDGFSISFNSELGTPTGEILYLPAESVEEILNDLYTVKVTATDEHGKEDSQDVRVLVDRPIHVRLSLAFPESYNIYSYVGGGGDTTPLYVVSKEDPILLQATIPADTETSNLQTIVLNYVDGSGMTDFGRRLEYGDSGISTEQCYNFPLRAGDGSTCVPTQEGPEFDLNPYYDAANNGEKIRKLTDINYYPLHPFQRVTDPAAPGTLSLSFNTNYCGTPVEEEREEINVAVKECVPVRNLEHPFAYPYHEFTFGTTIDEEGNTVTDFSNFNPVPQPINPLEATHSCCIGDSNLPYGWRVKTAEEGDCFVNPLPGCYGRITGLTTSRNNKGYLLEQEFATCDGTRGNICGSRQGRLYGDRLRCGNPEENPQCLSDIASACRGELSFGLIETENGDKGWCHGKMGCADFCQSELVYTLGDPSSYYAADDLNRLAEDNGITSDSATGGMAGFGFKCGCTSADEGNRCDKGFDGRFTGVCENGQCNDVICTPGQVRCEPDTIRNKQQCNSAGTVWESTGICASTEYCSEGICKPQICTPKELKCYPEYLSWVNERFPDYVDEVEAFARENPERERYPFFCTEEGSRFDDIEAACSPRCNTGVTVVEVSEDEWRCGACRESDWDNDRRCLKNGVRGECERAGRDRFECRE